MAQHAAVIDAAKAAGVAQLAYTGILGGPDADFTLADEHRATEQLILDSGLPYAFLRNGWYTENYTANLAPVLEHRADRRQRGRGPHRLRRAGPTTPPPRAAVLTGDGHLNTAYELSERHRLVARRVRRGDLRADRRDDRVQQLSRRPRTRRSSSARGCPRPSRRSSSTWTGRSSAAGSQGRAATSPGSSAARRRPSPRPCAPPCPPPEPRRAPRNPRLSRDALPTKSPPEPRRAPHELTHAALS